MNTYVLFVFFIWLAVPLVNEQENAPRLSQCARPVDSQVYYKRRPIDHGPEEIILRQATANTDGFTLVVKGPSEESGYGQSAAHWETRDGGKSWRKRLGGVPANLLVMSERFRPLVYQSYQSSDQPGLLFRLSDDSAGLLLRSFDAGLFWELPKYAVNGYSKEDYASSITKKSNYHLTAELLAFHPTEPRTIYANFRLQAWSTSLARVRSFPEQEPVAPASFVSRDAGDTWEPFQKGVVFALGIHPTNPLFIVAQGRNGLSISRDGGKNWSPVGQQPALLAAISYEGESPAERDHRERTSSASLRVHQFSFEPGDLDTFYFSSNKGVYRTTDGGKSWRLLNLGFDIEDGANSMAVNPKEPSEIFVATFKGLFRSGDRGCSFIRLFPQKDLGGRGR